MKTPRISVVTACFNAPDHLESTLCSILDQDYDNLQLIVIDGSSEDHTTAKLRHYRNSLDLWIRQRCDTMAQAINLGLARADGDIVGVLEAGHLYLPGTLDAVAKAMSHPAQPMPWLVGQCQRIDENDCRLGACMASTPSSLVAFLKHDSGVLPLPSSFWQRSLQQSIGQMDESLSICFDYDFNCRLLAAGHKPVILSQVLAARREPCPVLDAAMLLTQGREYISIALRHIHELSKEDRTALVLNCDQRGRIYALAEAELRHAVTPSKVVRSLLESQPQARPHALHAFLDRKNRRRTSLRKAI